MSTVEYSDSEWQRIWFSLRKRDWSSLALVPSQSGIDVLKVAETLAATGRLRGESPVTVIPALGVQLAGIQHVIDSIAEAVNRGEWALVVVDAITDNPSAIAVVQATSAALLLVRLRDSSVSAHNTLDTVGRERFLGSVVLDESSDAVAN